MRDRKIDAQYFLTDGYAPVPNSGGSFNLRSPLQFTLPPGAELKLDLGISFDRPVHVFQTVGNKREGLVLVDGTWAMHDSKEDIVLRLKNESSEVKVIDPGQTVARCVIIDNSSLYVVEE